MVPVLVDSLRYQDWNTGKELAEIFVSIGESVVDILVSRINSGNLIEKQIIVYALGGVRSKSSTKYLLPLLMDEHVDIRQTTVEALGLIADEGSFENLYRCIEDDSWLVRQAATISLGNINNVNAIRYLILALQDNDYQVRKGAIGALVKYGKEAIDPLTKVLANKNQSHRSDIIEALGEIGDPSSLEQFLAELIDDDHRVREAAAHGLGKIGDASAIKPLIHVLEKDENPRVRQASVAALGLLRVPCSSEYLHPFLKDYSRDVRSETVKSLGNIGNPTSLEHLICMLNDDEIQVKEAASDAIGKIGGTDIIASLDKIHPLDDWTLFYINRTKTIILSKFLGLKTPIDKLKSPETDEYIVPKDLLEYSTIRYLNKGELISYALSRRFFPYF